MEENKYFFINELGEHIPTVTFAGYQERLNALLNDYGISYQQLVESASFSFAMVVRAALAYSAADAYSVGIISDNLNSWVVLATLRHLVNASTHASVIYLKENEPSSELLSHLKTIQKMGIEIVEVTSAANLPNLSEYLEEAHNVLCGLSDLDHSATSLENEIIETFNTLRTPVHCIQAPFGLDPDSGAHKTPTLYASSTLSLGLPLQGLALANEFCGRNYICDISFTKELYGSLPEGSGKIFDRQPVIRMVIPKTEADETKM